MELGSVTLKRIGFFCFPIKHSTHTHAPHPPRMLWRVTCASPTLMCLCLCFCLLSRTANVRARTYALERLLGRVGHLAWACAVPMCVRWPMCMGMCVRARVRRQHLFV